MYHQILCFFWQFIDFKKVLEFLEKKFKFFYEHFFQNSQNIIFDTQFEP
jgi:hypothetical protein